VKAGGFDGGATVTPDGLGVEQVAERMAAGQSNAVDRQASRSISGILRENVLTLFNGILTTCFVVIVLVGDLGDGFFFGVVVVNALIGIVQELRAKAVLDRLALLSAPTVAVRRSGSLSSVAMEDVVIDDTLVLRPGDQIAADAVVMVANGALVDESLLTGESEPVAKDEGDALLSGSHVVEGNGYARVTAVGVDSYANRLTAEMRRRSLVHSELRAATNKILVWLSWLLGPVIVISIIGRVVAYGGFDQLFDWENGLARRAAIDAVAIVVGMIPEGLVLLTSLAFGVAAISLARTKVLVQELAAVEVLARVDTLCLDKTGTLTSGELELDRVVPLSTRDASQLVESALASFGSDDSANATAKVLALTFPNPATVVRRIPFNSRTKFSGVVIRNTDSDSSWLLGAPERLLAHHREAADVAHTIAATGMRTVALVGVDELPSGDDFDPQELTVYPSALVVFKEQLRPEAAETLRYFARQGVRVIVLSGDNAVTVGAIATELGIEGTAVDASTLVDDLALQHALENATVFGRVSPEQKRAAVGILQKSGHTVAMTGDGVNDAMAIKDADLGIAMGTATSATKAVSRIVLLDNRFDRLPNVLGLGRRTIANVERVANIFLAKTVYGIALAVVFAAVVLPYPFLPRQLTLISTLAIGIPSFFLALAPNRRIYRPGVLKRILSYSIPTGLVAGATVLAAYLPLSQWVSLAQARGVTTIALFSVSLWILCVLARPLNKARLGLLFGVVAALALACTVPVVSEFFQIELVWDAALIYGFLVGAAGACVIEGVYRVARSRHLVFDRN